MALAKASPNSPMAGCLFQPFAKLEKVDRISDRLGNPELLYIQYVNTIKSAQGSMFLSSFQSHLHSSPGIMSGTFKPEVNWSSSAGYRKPFCPARTHP